MTNVVEIMADQDDCAYDQPCRFSHRVEYHACYCHNEKWKDAPRKCRYGLLIFGNVPHSECVGFEQNPALPS